MIKSRTANFNLLWITELKVGAGPEGCAAYLTQVNPKDLKDSVLFNCMSHEFTSAEFDYRHVEKEAFG